MFRARILDDPEIGQRWGCERSDDNSSCQNFRFHWGSSQELTLPIGLNGLATVWFPTSTGTDYAAGE